MPSTVGGERFSFNPATNGDDLTDGNYTAFYAALVKAHGKARSDLVVQTALGSDQTIVTVVAVDGVPAASLESELSAAAFPGAPIAARTVSGVPVSEIAPAGASNPVWVFDCGASICVVDARTAGRRAAIFSALTGRVAGP
jgi:hypothetical protein